MTVQELYESIEGDYGAAKRIMMMDKMISRIIVKLLDDGSCGKLMEAGDAMDANGMFEAAHAMKGVCANLGLLKLSAAAGEICEEFRPGRERSMSDGQVAEHLENVRALYEKTLEGIRQFQAEQA